MIYETLYDPDSKATLAPSCPSLYTSLDAVRNSKGKPTRDGQRIALYVDGIVATAYTDYVMRAE